MPSYDLKPQLPAVTAPTLVTVGRARLGHPGQRRRRPSRPDAEREAGVFEKSGHSPQIEERELFLSTVRDFLDGAVS